MLAFATLLFAATVQSPPEQEPCPAYIPLTIDNVLLSPTNLKPGQTNIVEVEGENQSSVTVSLVSMKLYLQEDGTLYLQDSTNFNNGSGLLPWSTYNLSMEWTPATQNWSNGVATLVVNIRGTNDDLVGCILYVIDVNQSAMTLGLAAALLFSLNS